MKEIQFKNGTKLEVSQEVVNILRDKIISGLSGTNNFQFFSAKDDADLCINVSEIVCITNAIPY